MFYFLLSQPTNPFAIIPFSNLNLSICMSVHSNTRLLAGKPFTHIFSSIWPLENSKTMLFILTVILFIVFKKISFYSWIFSFVIPCYYSTTMHLVMLPLTHINPFIWPIVGTKTLNIVVMKFPIVNRSISKVKFTFSMLFPINIKPFVTCIIRPLFSTITVLFILFPLLKKKNQQNLKLHFLHTAPHYCVYNTLYRSPNHRATPLHIYLHQHGLVFQNLRIYLQTNFLSKLTHQAIFIHLDHASYRLTIHQCK